MNEIELGKSLSKKAGKIILKHFGTNFVTKTKSDFTPVTIVDEKINALVISEVEKYFPEHNIIAEEGSVNKGSDYSWVCDPLDGTIPFAAGIPMSTFSLALTHKGKSILGFVNEPFTKRVFFAQEEKGTFFNKKQVFVNENNTLDRANIGYCYWKINNSKHDFQKLIINLLDNGVRAFSVPSVVYMGASVATGGLSGLFFPGTSPWDIAALDILIKEAGGTTSDLFGENQKLDSTTKGFIGSNKNLYKELLKIAKRSI